MILDWTLNNLNYCSLHVNHTLLGDEEYKRRTNLTFYAPWQYGKEVHKNMKRFDTIIIKEPCLFNGLAQNQKITLADIFVFNEILTLNLIDRDLSKYPNAVLYIKRLAAAYPKLVEYNKSIQAYASVKKVPYYLDGGLDANTARL